MDKIVINATKRTVTGKQVKTLRKQGILPGVVYGHKFDPTPISMNLREASKILRNVSQSRIVVVDIEGNQVSSLVRERQKDYIRNEYTHIDFQAVSMTEKLRTQVSVVVHGISSAVKNYNGVVFVETDSIEVEALPGDLPENIMVDISGLDEIGQSILVKHIQLGEGVEILNDPEEVIVVITAGAEELVEEEAPEAEVAEPEVIERGKKEEEGEED